MTRLDIVRVARRLILMIGGEAMQSGFHFALNIALLHILSAQDYGTFAIVMVIGGLSLTYIRSLTAMPASIWIGRSRTRYAAGVIEVMFGSGAALLSLLTAVGVAILLQLWLGSGAVEGAFFVGLWSLRTHLRTAFFALGRSRLVGLADMAFTLLGAGTATLALWHGTDLLRHVLLALALANAVGIAVMLVLARRPVRVSLRRSIRRRYGGLSRQLGWSVLSVTMANLQGQGLALLVAGIAGPAAYAPIAAVLVLFVPLRVAATALINMIQAEIAALIARGEVGKVWHLCKVWTLVMGGAGLAYGAGMVCLLPFLRSQALHGTPVLVIGTFAWVIVGMTMLYIAPRIVLEVLTAFRSVALLTAVGAVVGMGTTRVILAVATPAWALAGGAVSEVLVVIGSWLIARRRLDAIAAGAPRPAARARRPMRLPAEPFAPPLQS